MRAASIRSLPTLLLTLLVAGLAVGCGDDDGRDPDGGVDAGPLPDGAMPDGFVPGDGSMPDGGMTGTDLFPPPTITTCPGDALEPPAEGTCTTSGSGEATLITGDILTPGEVLRGGQVLVDGDGMIACVGCDCSGMATDPTEVVCPDAVVSPGLINGHDHVTFANARPYPAQGLLTEERYEHRHDWRTGADGHTEVRAGGGFSSTEEMTWLELRQMMAGTTSIFGSGGPEGLLRNLDNDGRNGGLPAPEADYDTFPLGDQSGTKLTGSCDYRFSEDADGVMSLPGAYGPHVAEGIDQAARNEFLCIREGMNDLTQPNSAFIHGIGLLPPDIGEMALEQVELIWSPRTNVSLYGDTARVTEYARLGVTIGLGTDWVRSGSMNMLRELTCADYLNANHMGGFFPDEQLWLMATRNTAIALGVDSAIGTLETGKVADIAIFDASERTDHRAVIGAEPDDVVLVLRGGEVFFGDGDLVEALRPGCDPLGDVCGSTKRACLQETGFSFTALTAENGDSYDLFFCGEPEGEPTCVPERNHMGSMFPDASENGSNYYTGMSTPDDMDGDGIANGDDNCPSIFNPIRPLDEGMQADFDMDGIGDACDVCPLGGDDDPSTCVEVDPNDSDGDDVPNDMDNCPSVPNPEQEDMDDDGKGDVCDACPMDANPGGLACPATVYDVSDRTLPTGTAVSLEGLVVTGVSSNGFYAQQDVGSADYAGVDFSGIFVYTDSAPAPAVARGDLVTISAATVGEFRSQLQLTDPTYTVEAGAGTVPTPESVTTAEIAFGGDRFDELQGVLVSVSDVTVASTEIGGSFANFTIEDGVEVNDQMFTLDPFPTMGETFTAITGVLARFMDAPQLRPRDAADIIASSLRVSPGSITIAPSETVDITVILPGAAPSGGADVAITLPGTALTGPTTITVPEGMFSATETYSAAAGEDSGTLTASYMGDMVDVPVTVAEPSAIFFSEYVEGSGAGNKALEIVNPGGAAASLDGCEVRRYSNGSSSSSGSVSLSGSIAAGDVLVLCNSSIEDATECDVTSGTINHNGNDAYDLVCMGMVIDTFGQIGDDPGDTTGWSGGGLQTRDFVLRRQCSITMGDPDGSDAFDPSVEWEGEAWDSAATSLGGLGSHCD